MFSFLLIYSVSGNMVEMEGSMFVGEEVLVDMVIVLFFVFDFGGLDNLEKLEEELFEVERIVGLFKIWVSVSVFLLCEM